MFALSGLRSGSSSALGAGAIAASFLSGAGAGSSTAAAEHRRESFEGLMRRAR